WTCTARRRWRTGSSRSPTRRTSTGSSATDGGAAAASAERQPQDDLAVVHLARVGEPEAEVELVGPVGARHAAHPQVAAPLPAAHLVDHRLHRAPAEP